MSRKPSPAAHMFITSYWPDGSVHLPEAGPYSAPEGHRDNLRRRRRARNLDETPDALTFDTYASPACAPTVEHDDGEVETLAGMRTRLRFVPLEDVDPATRDPYAYPDGYDTVTDAHGAGPWEVVWSGRRTGGWFSRTFTDKGEAERYADELLTADRARSATVQRSA